jgi:hypothetical protein
MSQNVVNQYVKQYTANVVLLSQQNGSRLRMAVKEATNIGDGAVAVDQIGATDDSEATARYAPIQPRDLVQNRRWVYPQPRDWSTMLDSFDKVKLLADLTGPYTMTGAQAMKRRIDKIIIPAFFATAVTGVAGASTVAFPAGNQVSVDKGGTGSGLNVQKLIEGLRLLAAGNVDIDAEPVYCGITSFQHANLLNEIQVVSKDFNLAPVIESGRVRSILGVNFIQSELFATDASGYRRCPMWVPSGMHLGVWKDIGSKVSQRDDLTSQPWQVYMDLMMGATRVEEARVMELKCSEA